MGKYFGTDGIRGKAFKWLDQSLAFRVGQGLSHAFDLPDVIIGHDTRESSPMLAYMVASGALSQGLNVWFAGVCATPMLARYAKDNSMIGVMITASHNPYTDNGIKVFHKGYKTNRKEEADIEYVIDHPITDIKPFGAFSLAKDFNAQYVTLYDTFPAFKTHLNIVYDSANGGNYKIAQKIFDQFAPGSKHIGHHPDGLNINVNCGSTHMDHLQAFVKEHHYDIGFGFDGDGDRMLVCDQERIYDGDEIIYMIASYLRRKHQLKDDHIVLTKMSNPGLLKALTQEHISYTLTDVGDKHVTQVLDKHHYAIGGEHSGHIIIHSLLHTGDGLLAAIYLLYVLTEQNMTLKEALSNYTRYPYQLTNVKDVDKSMLKDEKMITFISDLKQSLGAHALLLVRASGTEPLIRITVSHQDKTIVKETTEKIVNYIHKRSEKHA